jgi:DNA transposition AAA+ family ATPase
MAIDKKIAVQVAAQLRDFIGRQGITQAKLAQMLGVGSSKLSQFLSGKYTAKAGIEEIVNKGLQLIESMSRKQRRVRQKPYIETTVAKAVGALVVQTEALSDEEGRIGLLIGDGGHGKSVCLRQYANANRNSIYIELDDSMTSTTMFAAIADVIGVDSAGSLAKVAQRVIQSLVFRHVVIMLDEASGLSVKQLNHLRQIIAVKARCPLVLAGNSDLLKTVMQPKTRRGCESLDQFTSRLSYILNLDKLGGEKDGGLYTVQDIRNLYEYGGVRLTGDAIKLLRRICRTPRSGRLRTCSTVVALLHTSRRCIQRGEIYAAAIISAIEQRSLPVRAWLPLATRDAGEQEQEEAVAKVG